MGKIEDICLEIHKLINSTPIFYEPKQVPFNNGLYFFYERGEVSPHSPEGRIVRVGNHPRSDNGLIRRLRLHYSGNKNSSVFRRLPGSALMRRTDPTNPCLLHWEKQDEPTCERCKPLEREISKLLRTNFWFRCIEIKDRGLRNMLEKKLIATISLCSECKPSEGWLGRYAYSDAVRRSGLWNCKHVFDRKLILHEKDLELLRRLVKNSLFYEPKVY